MLRVRAIRGLHFSTNKLAAPLVLVNKRPSNVSDVIAIVRTWSVPLAESVLVRLGRQDFFAYFSDIFRRLGFKVARGILKPSASSAIHAVK